MNSTKTSKVPKRNQYITVYYSPARNCFRHFWGHSFSYLKTWKLFHQQPKCREISQDAPTDHTHVAPNWYPSGHLRVLSENPKS